MSSFSISDDSRAVRAFDQAFISDNEFKELCNGLGISPSKHMELARKSENRVYLALREWDKFVRTRADVVGALVKMKHLALASQLGMAEAYNNMLASGSMSRRASFGQFSVELYNSLTPADRQSVLLLAGCPPGQAASYCDSIGNFLSTLALRCKFDQNQVDMSLWKAFPSLYNKIAVYYADVPGADVRNASPSNMALDLPPPQINISEKTLHVDARVGNVQKSNPFASAREMPRTFRTFVEQGGADYKRICADMNECEGWVRFLEMNDMLNSKDVADYVQNLRQAWTKRTNDPTDEVFRMLTETPIEATPFEKLWTQLKSIGNARLSESVEKWKLFCDATTESNKSSLKRTYTEASTLRQSLLDHKICKQENVDEALGKLTDPKIDITTLEDLSKMTKDELVSAGWSLKMAKDCVAVLGSK